MPKALFFDIDGTLVSFRTHRIPDSTLDAIEQARRKGAKVFISTGRPRMLINNLVQLEERRLIDGYITMNGAYCFVGEETIYKKNICPAEANRIGAFCKERGIPCIFVEERDIYLCQPNDRSSQILSGLLRADIMPVRTFEGSVEREVYQLTPFIDEADEAALRPHIPHCEVGRWHPAFADVTARGITKQVGIDAIAARFGIALEDTVAFGDGGNDISMLRHVRLGIAMGQAREEVKAAADYVTAPVDEDGVWRAMKHFQLC